MGQSKWLIGGKKKPKKKKKVGLVRHPQLINMKQNKHPRIRYDILVTYGRRHTKGRIFYLIPLPRCATCTMSNRYTQFGTLWACTMCMCCGHGGPVIESAACAG